MKHGLMVLTLAGGTIAPVTRSCQVQLWAHVELPDLERRPVHTIALRLGHKPEKPAQTTLCFRMVSFCLLTMEFMRLSPAASVYDSSSPPLPRQNVSASICVLQVAKYSSVQAPSTMVSTGVWPAAAGAAAAALTLGSETSHALY